MTCFQTGLAALLDVDLWLKWSTIVTAVATVFMAVIASLAACFARKQILTARKESKRAVAHAAYDRYLELCFENTKFSCGYSKSIYPNEDEIYKKYCWFVTTMLFAFEQILAVYPRDEEWNKTIRNQLRRHKGHLSSSGTVGRKEWSKELMKLIDKVIK